MCILCYCANGQNIPPPLLLATMEPRLRDILRKCPFNLSRLAYISGSVHMFTGLELIGMFLMAKQFGLLSGYKDIWTPHSITDPDGLTQKLLDFVPPACRNRTPCLRWPDQIASPVFDASTQTLNPALAEDKHSLPDRLFYLYCLKFAELNLPILAIGYWQKKKPTHKMCGYGGSGRGGRCFLTSSLHYYTVII